jgi:hypothetical protein
MSKQKTPPQWSKAPTWANWRAQDENGAWWWFSHEPNYRASIYFGFEWQSSYNLKFIRQGKPNSNWRETLEKRPE